MSIAERLITLRGKESRATFASKLGISANTLRNYESGLSLPNSDLVAKICTELGVMPGWMLLGESKEGQDNAARDETTSLEPKNNRVTTISDGVPTVKTGNFIHISEQLDVFCPKTSYEAVRLINQNAKFYNSASFLYVRHKKKIYESAHLGTDVVVLARRLDFGYDIYDANDLNTVSDFFVVEFVDLLLTMCKHGIDTYEAHMTRSDIENISKALEGKDKRLVDIESLAFCEQVKIPTVLYEFHENVGPEEDAVDSEPENQ